MRLVARAAFAVSLLFVIPVSANDPVTIDNVVAPNANSDQEPLAKEYSIDAAVRFLDSAALTWTKKRKCFTCHTNYAYLLARPMISHRVVAHQQVRTALETLVSERWQERGPRWDAEVVMSAAVLAHNDAATSQELHPATRAALDRMWTVQREDGGFDWLDCDWPPMESDDYYGATMALLAVGSAPDQYAASPAARKGMARLRKYLKANPPDNLHHQIMLMWGASKIDGIMTNKQKRQTIEKLKSIQQADGGWSLPGLMPWKRADDSPQSAASDGYASGFVVYALRQANVPKADPHIQRGVAWLKGNQRASGRWFTRSLYKDNHHFISHAGSAFAVMAIAVTE